MQITSINAIAFNALYCVANVITVISNIDGTINGMSAFRLDATGTNTPLLSESILSRPFKAEPSASARLIRLRRVGGLHGRDPWREAA